MKFGRILSCFTIAALISQVGCFSQIMPENSGGYLPRARAANAGGNEPGTFGTADTPGKSEAAGRGDFPLLLQENFEEINEIFTIEISGISPEDFDELASLKAYGDIVSSYKASGEITNDTSNITYEVEYLMSYKIARAAAIGSIEKLNEQDRRVLALAQAVIDSEIHEGMSDYEKEKAIHDYIVLNCEYDSAGAEADEPPADSRTPFGALINGLAVCSGYASAFKVFMDMLGIPCDYVQGMAEGAKHEWNRVRIGGGWYLVDVTWDDPVGQDADEVSYGYFNITDEMMSRDHEADEPSDKACDSVEYNYFVYNGLVVMGQKDFDAAVEAAARAGLDRVSLLCEGISPYGLDTESVFELSGNSRFSRSVNEKLGIISIYFE